MNGLSSNQDENGIISQSPHPLAREKTVESLKQLSEFGGYLSFMLKHFRRTRIEGKQSQKRKKDLRGVKGP
jgi:hypothetical protein